MTEQDAIEFLASQIEGELPERVEQAIGKILDHYGLTFRPVALNWQMGGIMQTQMMLVPKPKAEVIEG